MTDSERLKQVLNYVNLSTNALARAIGLKQSQTLYDIINGKHNISKHVAELISGKYLNINYSWVMTGVGEMLKNNTTKISGNINQDNKDLIVEDDNYESDKADSSAIVKVLTKMLESKDEQINQILQQQEKILQLATSKDEQINRLLTLLEKQNNN